MAKARQRRLSLGAAAESNGDGDADFRSEYWRMADALRGSMDAAEYKHVVLGLIFLKYISDAFEESYAQLEKEIVDGADPRRPGRIPRPEHLLGAARGALAGAARSSAPANHRDGRRRRHDRHRAGQPGAQRRAAQGLRPARAGQDSPGAGDRHGQQHLGGRGRGPRHGRPGQRLRILPRAVRLGRRPQGRRVLHPAQRGAAAGGDAGAVPGPGLRPLLRLLRHVRPVDRVHPGPRQRQRQRRQGDGGYLHLRPGVQLHHLAHGPDEPRDPRHRGANRPWRQLPQRPPPRPAGRLHPGQSAIQRLRLGRGAAAGRSALALRRPAQGQRQLRLGAALPAPPGATRPGRLRPSQRFHVVEPVRRRADPQEHHRGPPGGLHRRPAGAAV